MAVEVGVAVKVGVAARVGATVGVVKLVPGLMGSSPNQSFPSNRIQHRTMSTSRMIVITTSIQ